MSHVCPACQNEPGAECLACAFTCEACSGQFGGEYWSDERCNTTGYGVVLCEPCAHHCAELSDAAFLVLLSTAAAHREEAAAAEQELSPADLAGIIAQALNPETADQAHGALLTWMEAGSGGFDVSVEGAELELRVGGVTFAITVRSR